MNGRLSPQCISLLLVLVLAVLFFGGAASYRWNTYGEARTLHAWFSDLTLQFARNWYRDGVVALRGALFWKPASPEFPDLPSRRMHSSYPSGMLLPVYLAALIEGSDPMPRHVDIANACCQLALMMCCALIVFLFVLRAGGSLVDGGVFACVPLLLLSLLPCPFYYFDKCYFSYEAVVPLVALFLLLEMLRDEPLSKRAVVCLGVFQGITAFAGTFTEWLFPLAAGCVYLKRLLSGELCRGWRVCARGTALFWLPVAAALSLFAVQVYGLGGYAYLQDRFLLRTGSSQGILPALTELNPFWYRHMLRLFGGIGLAALVTVAAALLALAVLLVIRRMRQRPADTVLRTALWVGLAALVPCVAHVELLRNQSSFLLHGFEALKFSLPMAILPLVVIPLAALHAAGLRWPAWTFRPGVLPSVVPILALALAAGYVLILFPRIASLYASPIPDGKAIARAVFLDEETGPRDIVFTSALDLAQDDSPLYTAYSMKLVYLAKTLSEVHDKVRDIRGDYDICFFNPTARLPEEPHYARLLAQSEAKTAYGDYTLYRVSKEAFLSAWEDHPNDKPTPANTKPTPPSRKPPRVTGKRPAPSSIDVR